MAENNEEKSQQSNKNNDGGLQSEAGSILDRGDAIRQGIEQGITRYEELTKRIEAAAARLMLSGKAQGNPAPEKTEQEKLFEEAQAKAKASLARFGY